MKIELIKDPFDYRRFTTVVKYNQNDISNDDAHLFGCKIASELTEKTKTIWSVITCVGGKCNISTKIINKRDKRRNLKGQVIEVSGGILE